MSVLSYLRFIQTTILEAGAAASEQVGAGLDSVFLSYSDGPAKGGTVTNASCDDQC